MTTKDDLKLDARERWTEYGEAIVDAFRFPKGSKIESDGFEQVLGEADEERLRELIADIKARTEEMRRMKFVGEN